MPKESERDGVPYTQQAGALLACIRLERGTPNLRAEILEQIKSVHPHTFRGRPRVEPDWCGGRLSQLANELPRLLGDEVWYGNTNPREG
jgi:hypothetical protein